MLGESLSFPRQGDDWLKTILIGGVLSILGVFVIPILAVQGYLVRVLRAGVRGDREPPEFDDWADLIIDGILLIVIQFAYTIIPGILFMFGIFTVGAGALAGAGGSESAGAGIGIFGLLILFVAFLLLLLVAYLIPAALANFAYEDDLGAAFDIGTIREAAFTGDYFVAVLLAIVVAMVLGTIAGFLTIILVGIFLIFYVNVAVYYLFGRGFGKALGIDPGDGTGGTTADSGGGDDDDIPDPDPLT